MFAESFAKASFFNAIETYFFFFDEILTVASRKGSSDNKPSPIIANDIKHKKNNFEGKYRRLFFNIVLGANFFADAKRRILRAEAFDYSVEKYKNHVSHMTLYCVRKICRIFIQFYKQKISFPDKR